MNTQNCWVSLSRCTCRKLMLCSCMHMAVIHNVTEHSTTLSHTEHHTKSIHANHTGIC